MRTSRDILTSYLDLMKSNGHMEVPNVSLIPENDPTLLFVNSGMFPLAPYLGGEPHPLGKRLTNVQRSLRFEDIEEVGTTNRHTTQFHMIGNWSLGDYFKEEQLTWIYTFYVEKMGLDPQRIYATVFEGDEYAPKDTAAIKILKKIFKTYGIDAKEGERIFPYGKDDNWWQRGDAPGELGGPDSEVFYYLGKDTGIGQNPAENQDDFLEIGNSVFMQYRMTEQGGWEELPQKNVDFGGGLERIALVVQNKRDIFETDNFYPIIQEIEKITGTKYDDTTEGKKAMRILADHMRACTVLGMDGVTPGNKDQGYILRRLIRRMARFSRTFHIHEAIAPKLVNTTIDVLAWLYPDLKKKQTQIEHMIQEEENRFHKTLKNAEKKVQQVIESTGGNEKDLAQHAFDLFQSAGYPGEIFLEDLAQHGLSIDIQKFNTLYNNLFAKHKETSRTGAEKKFKGGLADTSEQVLRYHTATHLLHQALYDVVGQEVRQEGSNITAERLRFDFFADHKPTDEEIQKVQEIINSKIQEALPVRYEMMDKNEALKLGVKAFFQEKYGDTVKVYTIAKDKEGITEAYSKELCGGPHVKNTKEIGPIEIYKREKIGKQIYRIYARNKSVV